MNQAVLSFFGKKMRLCLSYLGILFFGLIMGGILQSAYPDTSTDVIDLQKKVSELEKRIANIESGVKVTPSSVSITSAGTVTLKGAVVNIGGSGKPVARLGDAVEVLVQVPGVGPVLTKGTITSGSATVLSN